MKFIYMSMRYILISRLLDIGIKNIKIFSILKLFFKINIKCEITTFLHFII